jgi:hypothetical protein
MKSIVLALASLLPQQAPRIDDMPLRVCLDAPRAIFQLENEAAVPVLVSLSVERWSDEGDAPAWVLVQQDITERKAGSRVRSLTIEAQRRRDFTWELKKRVGHPPLGTGRHRLVATYSFAAGEPAGTVTHEFVIVDCG